ncbi:HlyD family type I secretion periplasmic adaptor subunit [Sphingomonas glaciei]|uniref:Membrane fusion protein (MFP) family protein n=1 Tax=Sphingomonas glaciei TaxID=2938948 RepID=A0ABY5MR51_9SPHN|nr:HlyD family type I secretion periplasmic adaptor subunit [Sphingomonas glaciei]UUR06973.1 HlyD family type I secretion periplasmic adaptor subunit [Sphingomonas glaciei]
MNLDLPAIAMPSKFPGFGGGGGRNPAPKGVDDPSSDMRLGYIIAFVFFVLVIGWAALTRLDAAAMAPGKLVIDGQRQAVQHREGGVVGEIMVREGQRVAKGQVLLSLAAADVRAQERALSSQAITLLAQRARLQSEQLGRDTIATPVEFASMTNPQDRIEIARALEVQRAQLRTRLAVVQAQRGAFAQRRAGAGNLGRGYSEQVSALDQQIRSLDQELASLRTVAEEGFVSQSRIRALERARAELIGQRGQSSATVAQSRDQAGESRLQSLEAQSDYLARSATELRDVESALNDVVPKLAAARDQLARTIIRSPASGTVVGLQVFTAGGVISPGQRLMDIVPDRAALHVEGKLTVNDGDDVMPGQTAYVRFDSLHERSLPPLEGTVTRVSADSFTDEKTGESYFTAAVEVKPSQLALLKDVRGPDFQLRAGMPVTIEIPVRRRTALQYMLEPLTAAMRKAGREH